MDTRKKVVHGFSHIQVTNGTGVTGEMHAFPPQKISGAKSVFEE
jgi:hypothetical protein